MSIDQSGQTCVQQHGLSPLKVWNDIFCLESLRFNIAMRWILNSTSSGCHWPPRKQSEANLCPMEHSATPGIYSQAHEYLPVSISLSPCRGLDWQYKHHRGWFTRLWLWLRPRRWPRPCGRTDISRPVGPRDCRFHNNTNYSRSSIVLRGPAVYTRCPMN